MKRLAIPLLLLLAICSSSCKKGLGDKFAGTYAGTYTFINDDNKTKAGKVPVTKDPTEKDNIMLYYVLPLNHVSGDKFNASDIQNSETLAKILNAIFGDNSETAEGKIKNMNIEASFDGNQMDMKISYELEIVGIPVEAKAITFKGEKE